MPSKSFAINYAWCVVVALACDLLAWLALLGLDGDLAKAEPKTIRYRLLHTAGRIIHGQHKRKLRILHTWPWAHQLQTAFTRITALPAPGGARARRFSGMSHRAKRGAAHRRHTGGACAGWASGGLTVVGVVPSVTERSWRVTR
jgi:hypothetical protein